MISRFLYLGSRGSLTFHYQITQYNAQAKYKTISNANVLPSYSFMVLQMLLEWIEIIIVARVHDKRVLNVHLLLFQPYNHIDQACVFPY